MGIKHEGDGRDEAGEDLVLHLEDLGEAFKVISPLPWEQRLTLLWPAPEQEWTEWGPLGHGSPRVFLCSPRSSLTPVQTGTRSQRTLGTRGSEWAESHAPAP